MSLSFHDASVFNGNRFFSMYGISIGVMTSDGHDHLMKDAPVPERVLEIRDPSLYGSQQV